MKYLRRCIFSLLLLLLPSCLTHADGSDSTSQPVSFTIPLAPNAWNLISIPVELSDESISGVLGSAASSIDTIYRYAPEISDANDGWEVYQANHPELSSLTSLQPGFGYFVHATASTSIIGSGTSLKASETPPSRKLEAGWNLVGVLESTDDHFTDIDQVFSSIGFSGVDYLSLLKLDPETQSFTTPDTASPGDAFWMLLDSPHEYGPSDF